MLYRRFVAREDAAALDIVNSGAAILAAAVHVSGDVAQYVAGGDTAGGVAVCNVVGRCGFTVGDITAASKFDARSHGEDGDAALVKLSMVVV